MDADLKKILKAVVLAMRHSLEGKYNEAGIWQPGDLESRLAEIGVRQDRESVPAEEMPSLTLEDQQARRVVDGYLKLRQEAGVLRGEAVREFVRESAYTWANRLLALRCMEARELIDEAILQKSTYGGRSLEHHRLIQRNPELSETPDDGRFAMLNKVFTEQAKRLPNLFDPSSPSIALRPSPAALKQSLDWLSGSLAVRSQPAATDEVFQAPDALGWAYQYWNTDEKKRVFDMVKTVKGAKIAGADIVPATQLYTEDYMVKFLVQNSLGATWRGMYPESKLGKRIVRDGATEDDQTQKSVWEYYVDDADRVTVSKKPVREITLLDPACGSGHFLIEAFDMFYDMYVEEGVLSEPSAICLSILENNLFGIDIDLRAIQIAEVALWMKAAERVVEFDGAPTGLVAAVASHLKGESWERFLNEKFIDEPSVPRVLRKFALAMTNVDQLGTLARPAEELKEIIRVEHETWEKQQAAGKESNFLFSEMLDDVLAGQLPFKEMSDEQFGHRMMNRAIFAIDGFTKDARDRQEFDDSLLGSEAKQGFRLLQFLSNTYDVVVANPPYMGSKNMSPVLKSFLNEKNNCLVAGKRDLYAAFLVRSRQLCKVHGRIAMITLDGWCFKKQFAPLRTGYLAGTSFECLVYLSRHAFSDADPPGLPVMSAVCNKPPSNEFRIWSTRFTVPLESSEQSDLLMQCSAKQNSQSYFNTQISLSAIPESGLYTWIPQEVLNRMVSDAKLNDLAECLAGLQTGDSPRFVRLHWECPRGETWIKFASGGGICKWAGLELAILDWRVSGSHIEAFPKSCWRGTHRFGSIGFTYSESARGKLAFREMLDSGFSQSGSAIFARDNVNGYALMAFLCGRYASYCSRFLRPGRAFPVGYLALLPIPTNYETLATLTTNALSLKKWLCSKNLIEFAFVPDSDFAINTSGFANHNIKKLSVCCALLQIEGAIEHQIFDLLCLSSKTKEMILAETGIPAGWLPGLKEGTHLLPSIPVELDGTMLLRQEKERLHSSFDRVQLENDLREFFESGSIGAIQDALDESDLSTTEADVEQDDNESETENNESEDLGNGVVIPPELFLEYLANQLKTNPRSLFDLLKHWIETEGLRCRHEEFELCRDRLTYIILRAFGHRWPSHFALGLHDPLVACKDGMAVTQKIDGVCDLVAFVESELDGKSTDFGLFAEITGTTVSGWIKTKFFEHHVRQFKKRPVVWHISSLNSADEVMNGENEAAFDCFVHCHYMNIDTLAKIRSSEFVGSLRLRLETELRGINQVNAVESSDRQTKRKHQLETKLFQLQKFDEVLASIVVNGFCPTALSALLTQNAISEGVLVLKSSWLKRLGQFLLETEFKGWKDFADGHSIHKDLSSWIKHSLQHIDYHCDSVGFQLQKHHEFKHDPTSVELAELIASSSSQMALAALKCACDAWWRILDEVTIAPMKEKLKSLKDMQAEFNCSLQTMQNAEQLSVSKIGELKEQIKQIKSQLKAVNLELKRKTTEATKLREKIEAWRSDEPTKWGDWLGTQPMFDQISSLDDRRPPPKTVAEFVAQESMYVPNINDGVRVNIAPLQRAGILAADVLAPKDVDRAIADRAEWRADERRWVRQGILPRPGWWPEQDEQITEVAE